ncbi:MAG TPA: type II toxin-antitoxin system VapC family toxin [Candidatus Angelobacter sp.]|nr:type II toxin-antitoxin system VapC family toxin [Candidatus Angelobacter sp.]
MTATTASDFLVVDSSGWIEYFGDGAKAGDFEPYLHRQDFLLVPTIVLYEVCKKLSRERGKTIADRFVSQAFRCVVVALDEEIALVAASLSLEHRLSMADAIIYATAQTHAAQLVTGDSAFQGLPGVTIL